MTWSLLQTLSSAQIQKLAEEEYYRQKMIETIVGLSITAIIVAAPTYWLIRYVYFKIRKEFRFKTRFNPYNHIDALVLLSMNVLRTHPDCFKEKCIYLKEYIIYLYPENHGSFNESLKMAYKDVYRSESIVYWLCRFLSEEERKDVVRFLIHMAAQDGVVALREKAELIRIIDSFGLPHREWLELMESINTTFARRQERWNKSNDARVESYQASIVDKALVYFEMQRETLEGELLRTKYRKLVKKYHPDRHPDATTEERKELEVKFQELQLYYDELLKLLS
ncbi:TerB family tellurite resistance protein [Fluviicola sp.]|uniref:TerB family tellurite resistance protein n=1 Tax=Fluviicola sp. TaxID=1917219 RepID=UPI0031DD90B1